MNFIYKTTTVRPGENFETNDLNVISGTSLKPDNTSPSGFVVLVHILERTDGLALPVNGKTLGS